MNSQPTSILVIAAHPDDEVLGCGGAIAMLADRLHSINILIMNRHNTARPDFKDDRLEQCKLAANWLSAKSVELLDYPDNMMDTVPFLQVVQDIERAIAKYNPTIVFTHHPGDLNIDHRITSQATITAARPVSGVQTIYFYEVPSATDWAFRQFEPSFKPNAFMAIDHASLQQKLNALRCYPYELREAPHPRSMEGIYAAAARWGNIAGFAYAEAFEIMRTVI